MERGSAGRPRENVAGAVILAAWVLAMVVLIVLGSLGYVWHGGAPAGLIAWLGGVLMLGGLGVYGLMRPEPPARPPVEPEADEVD
jgi:hypothetical protein